MKRNEVLVYEHKKGVRARKYNTKYVDPTKKSDTLIEPAKPPKKKEVDEASKKPNATTRHLRDYPVSDKDLAKPVKKPEKKKPEQGVAEGSLNELDTSTLKSYRGKANDEVNAIKQKQKLGQLSDKDFFKKQDRLMGITGASKRIDKRGMAEGSLETDNMVSHIGQVIQSIYPRGGDKNTYMKLVAREMPRIVKANPKLFRRAFGMAYDRFFHIDQDDDFDYTDYSMRKGERGMAEGRFGRSSYYNPMDQERREQDAMDYERRAFKRAELQHELGHEDDPDFERNLRQQQIDRDRGPWYIKVDGKILKVKGEPKVFDWKRGANNYALAILKNKPELQGKIFLSKKPEDTQDKVDEDDAMGTISAATPDGKVKIKTTSGQEIETTKDQLVPGEGGSVQMKPASQDAFKPGTKVTTPATEDMMAPPTDSQSPIPGDNDHDEISKLLVLRLKRLAGL